MAKDAYYFSHDSNAKDDPKCVLLIEQLGLEGYGIYWVLIETLRDQPDYRYPLSLTGALARRYNTTNEKVKTVINKYGLFVVDDDNFFSLSLLERMAHLEDKREKARLAGLASARKRLQLQEPSTDVQPTFNGCSTTVQPVKESKVKESKVKVSAFKKPTLEEIREYSSTGYPIDAERFLDYYESNGWKVGRAQMKDWKATVRNWSRKDQPKGDDFQVW